MLCAFKASFDGRLRVASDKDSLELARTAGIDEAGKHMKWCRRNREPM